MLTTAGISATVKTSGNPSSFIVLGSIHRQRNTLCTRIACRGIKPNHPLP